MSYVDKNLMDGERVVYRTRRHWVIYTWPILILLLGTSGFVMQRLWIPGAYHDGLTLLSLAVWGGGLLGALPKWIERRTSEFAVTNKRVIVKVGWIERRSIETLLTKIEAIEVMQGIGGRMLDYGTIIIIGTGGTKEPFERISAPLEFRRKVQEQIIAFQAGK